MTFVTVVILVALVYVPTAEPRGWRAASALREWRGLV